MSNELKIDVPDIIKKKLRAIDSFAKLQQAMPDPIFREAADAIEQLQRELHEAREALAYAITEADGWFDECRGGEAIKTPEMDAARRIAAKQSQG